MVNDDKIKTEFNKSTEKFHVIACWVGFALNLLWSLGDYLTVPELFKPFFIFRLSVCLVSLAFLLSRNKTKLSIYFIMFLLVLGISIQNAFMWNMMDVPHMQKHTFAYMALFICVGMLVLWEVKLSIILLIATVISNVVFFIWFSKISVDEFLVNGGLLTLTVAIACVFIIRQRYRLTFNEIKSRLELEESKNIIEIQKTEVEQKNIEITSSLRYAKRLQEALLPPKNLLKDLFGDNFFVYYLPRDIVCGDFYWAKKIRTTPANSPAQDYVLMAVADCTGHGVPGAFMSLLGSNFLHQSSVDKNVNTPAEALDHLNKNIIKTLNHGYGEEIRDGMDIAFVAINMDTLQMAYAGANNPVLVVRQGELITLKPNKQAIGNLTDVALPYTNLTLQLEKGDTIYLFSDGYADQFGGPNGKKLMRKNFENLLISNHHKTMIELNSIIENHYQSWKGNHEQVDDVCVVGIRV